MTSANMPPPVLPPCVTAVDTTNRECIVVLVDHPHVRCKIYRGYKVYRGVYRHRGYLGYSVRWYGYGVSNLYPQYTPVKP